MSSGQHGVCSQSPLSRRVGLVLSALFLGVCLILQLSRPPSVPAADLKDVAPRLPGLRPGDDFNPPLFKAQRQKYVWAKSSARALLPG
eukprot:5027872-Amphidinium_carterae.2